MPGKSLIPGAASNSLHKGRRGGESESLEEEAIEIGNSYRDTTFAARLLLPSPRRSTVGFPDPEKVRPPHALAAGRRHLFYGVGRNLWHRRHRARRRLWTAILILLLTPLLWSLPTAFMIGELSSALPFEGGYYAWVRRAMGNFWGFQEAWLSLVASIFDMAIYPTLFVAYLTRMFPWFQESNRGWWVALAVVVACALLNIAGVKVVSTHLALAVLGAFGAVRRDCLAGSVQARCTRECGDQADDFDGRHSRRTADLHVELHGMGQRVDDCRLKSSVRSGLIRGRCWSRSCIVALSYVLPFAAMWATGLKSTAWETGSWADIAGLMGGPLLRIGAGAGRNDQRVRDVQCAGDELFAAAAGDGAGWHAAESLRQAAPEIASALGRDYRACAVGWALCLGLGFARLVTLDILLYGASLALEFVALIVLRFREPELRVRSACRAACLERSRSAFRPCCCWAFSVIRSEHESILGMSSFAFGMILIAAGVVAYLVNHALKPEGWSVPASEKSQPAA